MTVTDLIVGAPSTVKIGAYGVGEGSCVDLGLTEGGVKLKWNTEMYYKTADQVLGKVGAVKTSEDLVIELDLAEISLANLAYAFGYPTSAVTGTTLYIGGNSTVTEWEMYINTQGSGAVTATRKVTVYKCVIASAFEYNSEKANKTLIHLVVQVLQDTSQTDNQEMISITNSSGDTTAPTVAMTSPAEDGSVSAGTTNAITLTFTEAGSGMDEGTLIYGNADNATIFVNDVEDPTATALVAGSIAYNRTTKILTFTPDSNWAAATNNYQIIITTGVSDNAGNNLANVFFGHFVTV